MKSIKLTYQTIEVCKNSEGVILKDKTTTFGPDPLLSAGQSNTYMGRTMKKIQRDPESFLDDLGYKEGITEGLVLDIGLYLIVEDGKTRADYFLYSLHKVCQKNLNKEKKLMKTLEHKRNRNLVDNYINLFENSETFEDVTLKPFPIRCFFRSREINTNEGIDNIISQKEFRLEDYNNYIQMQKEAKSYHNNSLSDLINYNPFQHLQQSLNSANPGQSHYFELYLVIIEEDQEHAFLRLRNNSVNLDGMDLDLYFERLCMMDINAFLKAKLEIYKKRARREKGYKIWKRK